ncbi:hypothetical protein LZ495_43400, partial [Yinghuangia sp. KLBMP8922]|nr:hypothetical protein [Yinghuangia soli]
MKRAARQFEGTEAEFAALTREVDEAHRATLPAMYASAAELGEQIRDRQAAAPAEGLERRSVLRGLGVLGLSAFALAACSDDSKSTTNKSSPSASGPASSSSASGAGGTYTGDLQVVALATALENQAVAAYQAAIQAAGAGKLGTVPPAVASFATTAMAQHA